MFYTVLYWEIRVNTAGPCSAQKGRIWPTGQVAMQQESCLRAAHHQEWLQDDQPRLHKCELVLFSLSWGVLNDLGWHDKIMKMQKQWQSGEEATSTTSCTAVDSSPSRIPSRVFLTVKEMCLFACCHSVKHCAESPGTKVERLHMRLETYGC